MLVREFWTVRSVTGVEDPREETVVVVIFRNRFSLGSICIAAQHSVNFFLMLPLLVGHREDRNLRCGALRFIFRYNCAFLSIAVQFGF